MLQQIVHGEEAVVGYIRRLINLNREFIGEETLEVRTLVQLLRKPWNTGRRWTGEELREVRSHMKNALKIVYAFLIFLLPGGLFLLPFVAEWLHRPKS